MKKKEPVKFTGFTWSPRSSKVRQVAVFARAKDAEAERLAKAKTKLPFLWVIRVDKIIQAFRKNTRGDWVTLDGETFYSRSQGYETREACKAARIKDREFLVKRHRADLRDAERFLAKARKL